MKRIINHSSLLAAGFELIRTGSKNVYELKREDDGLFLDHIILVGEYKDPRSPFKYWMTNGVYYQLPDLKPDNWDLLSTAVKNNIGIDINQEN